MVTHTNFCAATYASLSRFPSYHPHTQPTNPRATYLLWVTERQGQCDALVETTGAIYDGSVWYIAYLARRARGKNVRDGTPYGRNRMSAQ